MKYTSDVELDDMGMPFENFKESCKEGELSNLTSSLSPLHPSEFGADPTGAPLATNIAGDYLKMGGGFCIDEEGEVSDES